MTERQRMLAGEYYDPGDPELAALRRRARQLCARLDALPPHEDYDERLALLRELLGSAGEDAFVESGFRCDYGCNLYVGDHFFANFDCVILDVAEVRIGNDCMLAPQVGIYTATHPLEPTARRSGLEYARPVTIGNDCWIGGMAVINPGVTLGNGVVVASGAVVTHSFGDNLLLAGNPARVIRELEDAALHELRSPRK